MGAAPGMNAPDSHCYYSEFTSFSNINNFQIAVSRWLSSRALKWLVLSVLQIILVLSHKPPSFLCVFIPVSVLLLQIYNLFWKSLLFYVYRETFLPWQGGSAAGTSPLHQKVADSIPGQGTHLDCRFNPQSGYIRHTND